MIALLCLLTCIGARAQSDSLLLVFWNTENFFHYNTGYEPSRHWSRKRFEAKCNGIAKTLFAIADKYGRLPDAIGLAEIENEAVLRSLVGLTPLRKAGYGIIHFDSPDSRGIDCALLYRKERLSLQEAAPKHLYDSLGSIIPTRDILLAQFDSVAILVNHHPSKISSGSPGRRNIAMHRMQEICDSLSTPWIAVGDFNDDLWHHKDRSGTIKYNGKWEKIDGCFHSGFRAIAEEVQDFPFLLEKDKSFGGLKPRRTYIGPRYNRGISDHLPIAVVLIF